MFFEHIVGREKKFCYSFPGFSTDRKEQTGTPCYKEWSFPSLLVWQRSYCQSLESSHLHLLIMDMLPLSSRSLKIGRVRQLFASVNMHELELEYLL